MRTITLLIALLFTQCCFAQESISFALPTNLSIGQNNACHKLHVIDMRTNKDTIGIVYAKPSNRKETKIISEQPLDDLLSNYFDTISASKKGEYELLLVLHDFYIAKKLRTTDIGYFHFRGDFYIGKEGKYCMLDSVDRIYELGRPIKNFTDTLIFYTQNTVFDLLNKYAAMPVNVELLKLTEQDARNRQERLKAQYPIYTGDFKKGIYLTLEQFLSNSPADTAVYVNEVLLEDRTRLYYYHYQNAKGKAGKKIYADEFFAIYCDGKWHLGGRDKDTRKMWYEHGEFIATREMEGILPPGQGNARTMANGAAAAFGLVGGAVAGVVTLPSPNEELTGRVIYLCRFDPAKKQFIPMRRFSSAM
jgi:hypothetical protein